jgi:hypothetical protein
VAIASALLSAVVCVRRETTMTTICGWELARAFYNRDCMSAVIWRTQPYHDCRFRQETFFCSKFVADLLLNHCVIIVALQCETASRSYIVARLGMNDAA